MEKFKHIESRQNITYTNKEKINSELFIDEFYTNPKPHSFTSLPLQSSTILNMAGLVTDGEQARAAA